MILQRGSNIILPQWFAGFGVTILMIELGCMVGWSSPTLAILMAPDSPIPLSPEEGSWVASFLNLNRFFGAILGSVLVNYLGSKGSLFVTLIPVALGWLGIALADGVNWLCAARLSSGIAMGMSYSAFPLYLGEVSMPEIRGALISLATCGAPFGQLLASIASSYLSLSMAAIAYLIPCLFLMLMFLWLPESPHHLVKLGKRRAARKSINWYRAGQGVDAEMQAVEKLVASAGSKSFIDILGEFRKPPIRKATLQIITLFVFMHICGLNSVIIYMETILSRAKFALIAPSDAVIYVNICATCSAAASIFLIDRCGRKFLLLLSSAGTSVSMFGLTIHFLLIDMEVDVTNLQWLPISSMFVFVVAFFVGLMTVPSTILSELFPADVKCVAACIAGLTGATASFLASKSYQPMVDAMGLAYVFLIYAICSIVVIPYTLLFVRETKGKCLQQIQDELMKK